MVTNIIFFLRSAKSFIHDTGSQVWRQCWLCPCTHWSIHLCSLFDLRNIVIVIKPRDTKYFTTCFCKDIAQSWRQWPIQLIIITSKPTTLFLHLIYPTSKIQMNITCYTSLSVNFYLLSVFLFLLIVWLERKVYVIQFFQIIVLVFDMRSDFYWCIFNLLWILIVLAILVFFDVAWVIFKFDVH